MIASLCSETALAVRFECAFPAGADEQDSRERLSCNVGRRSCHSGDAQQVAEAVACCWCLLQLFAMISAAKEDSASFRLMLLNYPQQLVLLV